MGNLSVVQKAVPSFLANMTTEQSIELNILVGNFKRTQERVCYDLYIMAQTLVSIQKITGENFYEVVEEMLGLGKREVNRFLHIDKVVGAHFMTGEGRANLQELSKFTKGAFRLLSPDTDEEIVVELREIAKDGKTVDEKAVKAILERHSEQNAQKDAEIAHLSAELARTKKIAESEANEKSRLFEQAQLQRDRIQQLSETNQALDHEIADLRKKEIQIVEKDKEVPPAGYLNIEQAIQDAESRKAKIMAEIEEAQEKQKSVEAQLRLTTAGAEDFLRLKADVEGFLLKYPVTMIRALSGSNPAIRTHIQGISEYLAQFSDQLKTAIA